MRDKRSKTDYNTLAHILYIYLSGSHQINMTEFVVSLSVYISRFRFKEREKTSATTTGNESNNSIRNRCRCVYSAKKAHWTKNMIADKYWAAIFVVFKTHISSERAWQRQRRRRRRHTTSTAHLCTTYIPSHKHAHSHRCTAHLTHV